MLLLLLALGAQAQTPMVLRLPKITEADLVVSNYFTIRWEPATPAVNFWAYRRGYPPHELEYQIPVKGKKDDRGVVHYVVPDDFESPFAELLVWPGEHRILAIAKPKPDMTTTLTVRQTDQAETIGLVYSVELDGWILCEGSGCPQGIGG